MYLRALEPYILGGSLTGAGGGGFLAVILKVGDFHTKWLRLFWSKNEQCIRPISNKGKRKRKKSYW